MKSTAELLNEAAGLADLPESYRLPDACMFCRNSRTEESMAVPSYQKHPIERDHRKCFLHNCWVCSTAVCGDYSMLIGGTK